jgi:hypothetical protein
MRWNILSAVSALREAAVIAGTIRVIEQIDYET